MDTGTGDLAKAPDWYVEAKELERAEAEEAQAKTKEAGETAAVQFAQTLRSFLPDSMDIIPHWGIRNYGQITQAVYPWAEVRLTDDITIMVGEKSGRHRACVPALKIERELLLSPPGSLLKGLASIVDEVHEARAQQAEGERQAEQLREQRERERDLAETLAQEEAAAFKPITLYELAWPRAVADDGSVETGRAWSIKAEPDADGFYTVLAFGELRRRKIVLSAGAIEVTEHVFESFDVVPTLELRRKVAD